MIRTYIAMGKYIGLFEISYLEFFTPPLAAHIWEDCEWGLLFHQRWIQRMLNVILHNLEVVQILHPHLLQRVWWNKPQDWRWRRDCRNQRVSIWEAKIFKRWLFKEKKKVGFRWKDKTGFCKNFPRNKLHSPKTYK